MNSATAVGMGGSSSGNETCPACLWVDDHAPTCTLSKIAEQLEPQEKEV